MATPNFWDHYEAPTNFLTEEQRKRLVNDGTVFQIVDVQDGTSKFGPTWTFSLNIPGYEKIMQLSMQHNSIRDHFALAAMRALAHDSEFTIPAKLTMVRTSSGQNAYVFVAPDADTANVRVEPDDIPF